MHPRRHTSDTNTTERAPAEQGQATVEFALVLVPLCIILFGIVEFGMAFWTYQQVSAAASEGARRASISRTYTDRLVRVDTAAKQSSPNLKPAALHVTTTSTWDAGAPVTVRVAYPESITVMGIPFFTTDLVVSRTMRVEQ
ncbi:MAG: TadE/TadG family type IV pilus assembly protein [Gaiellales bacterium]